MKFNSKDLAAIVEGIWKDLCDRQGYDFDAIDDETQQDIRDDWSLIVTKALMNIDEGDGWIPVSERLPETNGLVLIYAPSADRNKPVKQSAWYDPDGIGWSLLPMSWTRAITHWMPLPPAPEGD